MRSNEMWDDSYSLCRLGSSSQMVSGKVEMWLPVMELNSWIKQFINKLEGSLSLNSNIYSGHVHKQQLSADKVMWVHVSTCCCQLFNSGFSQIYIYILHILSKTGIILFLYSVWTGWELSQLQKTCRKNIFFRSRVTPNLFSLHFIVSQKHRVYAGL